MIIFKGKVIHGDHYGRKLGFPTANIDRRDYKRQGLKLKFGIYAGAVFVSSRPSASERRDPLIFPAKRFLRSSDAFVSRNSTKKYKAAIVIGPLDKNGLPKIEAHLLNFKGNLYGKNLALYLNTYLRPFRKYQRESELINQIGKDIKQVKKLKYGSAAKT